MYIGIIFSIIVICFGMFLSHKEEESIKSQMRADLSLRFLI